MADNQVVEAEAAANTEALPIPSEEPKKVEAVETTEEEKKPANTEAKSAEVVAPAPLPEIVPAPKPVTTPIPAPEPPKVEELPTPTPAPEPVIETKPEPSPKEEMKSEEMPPPLPASPPPTEAPPPTPVAPTPAPVELIPEVILHVEPDTQEPEVVGGGGESMAEPEDMEPVLDTEEKVEDLPPMVNGVSDHDHNHQFVEEFKEKVEIVTDNLKTIVTESLISTQVTENSEDKSEQTASAAE